MPDLEKVIKGWECHIEADTLGCADCPYREGWRTCNFADTLYKDVYALLKEQEAVKPTFSHRMLFCGACGLRIRGGKFCSECGKPIAWEEQVKRDG